MTFAAQAVGEQVLAYLHEPGGQPFREENGIGAGYGEQAGTYMVDGRDVVPGLYEAVAVAPPLDGASATIGGGAERRDHRRHSGSEGVVVHLTNVGSDNVASEPFAALVGAERTVKVVARGSEVQRIKFQLPDWAVHAVVDIQMDRAQWPIFTDFGSDAVRG